MRSTRSNCPRTSLRAATRAGAASAVLWCGVSGALAQPQTAEIPITEEWSVLIPQRAPGVPTAGVVSGVDAQIRISGAVATTTMTVRVTNASRSRAQARLVLPVPAGAAIRTFGIDGVGAEPTAELLPREEAVRRYEEIVRRMVDPGLLEFVGHALIQSSVFPIEPGAERTMTIVYEHTMDAHRGRVEYVLPRSASLAGSGIPWTVRVEVESASELGPVFSPSHPIVVVPDGGGRAVVTVPALEEPGSFRLCAVTGGEPGKGTVLLYPDGDGSGYFMFVADAPEPADRTPTPRELTIVIDRSGSMGGQKIAQAKESARQVLAGLRDGERFNVIDYSDDVRSFAPAPVERTPESLERGLAYIAAIESRGGTNLHDALVEALRPTPLPGSLPVVLFLTDGLPTVGVTAEQAIRQAARDHNGAERRVFTFGVGFDVNAPLLDGIALDTKGDATFVLPNENVEIKVGQVFDKLDGPVMIDPVFAGFPMKPSMPLDGPGPGLSQIEPRVIRDLYAGSRVMVLGRYEGGEPIVLRLASRGEPDWHRAILADLDPAEATTRHGYIPRLWAQRRIDALITQIRLNTADGSEPDAELVDEITRLSLEYGIMTEYTAFLAAEDLSLADAAQERDESGELGLGYTRARREVQTQTSARSGKAGVSQSLNRQYDRESKLAGSAPARAPGAQIQLDAVKTNTYYDGSMNLVRVETVQRDQRATLYRKADRWVDARLGEQADLEPELTVEFGTDAYWELVEDLASQHRQWTLANRGEVYLLNRGRRVLVRNPL